VDVANTIDNSTSEPKRVARPVMIDPIRLELLIEPKTEELMGGWKSSGA
jgi:hypothetical protein